MKKVGAKPSEITPYGKLTFFVFLGNLFLSSKLSSKKIYNLVHFFLMSHSRRFFTLSELITVPIT